jgi:hypothetical protein
MRNKVSWLVFFILITLQILYLFGINICEGEDLKPIYYSQNKFLSIIYFVVSLLMLSYAQESIITYRNSIKIIDKIIAALSIILPLIFICSCTYFWII